MTTYNTNCRYFTGYKPCKFQKINPELKCNNECNNAERIIRTVLIIKKGAMGEVLRCTPLLRKLKNKNTFIVWMTDYPELINRDWVDMVLGFSAEDMEIVKSIQFDTIYSLDKELPQAILGLSISGMIKYGYTHRNKSIIPFGTNEDNTMYDIGINDNLMKQNKRHYMDMLFSMCGLKFNEEKYILPKEPSITIKENLIGINTGASNTWKTRQLSINKHVEIVKESVKNGYEILLLGGEQEYELNRIIKESVDVFNNNTKIEIQDKWDIESTINYVNKCNTILTVPTFIFHVAVGSGKRIVLLNSIFNKHEFYNYDKEMIVLEPNIKCKMCYKSEFDKECELTDDERANGLGCLDKIPNKEIIRSLIDLANK